MDKNDKDIELARSNMIEQQIRPAEVLDPRVLETISETPREAFVPETYQNLALLYQTDSKKHTKISNLKLVILLRN